MRKFSVRPTLTLRGRKFKGLRGWSGKPTHPPLTDLPIAPTSLRRPSTSSRCSAVTNPGPKTSSVPARSCSSAVPQSPVLAALTGFWDWLRSTEKGTQARRTANTHAWTMITVTVLALVDIALRLNVYHTRTYPSVVILVLSIVVAALVTVGATFGGSLVFEYGFNVETATDSPVWHESESDVLPGEGTPPPPEQEEGTVR